MATGRNENIGSNIPIPAIKIKVKIKIKEKNLFAFLL